MRLLSAEILSAIPAQDYLELPFAGYEQLPEKVLQFGTGVLLRGLPDFFIDLANRQGVFNGRIVVVKSTDKGDTKEFDQQNNLYTICIRGIENGQNIEKNIVCSAISRVLTAKTDWDEILAVATQPELKLIISNTTEVGLRLVLEDIHDAPPSSFPAKLLACLYARYQIYGDNPEYDLVIVPTELIPGNGDLLKKILLELAEFNQLETHFKQWLLQIDCCNSLVDRIVPGKPNAEIQSFLTQSLGYRDELALISESYALWAIEGGERVKEKLSFAQAHPGVIVAESIELYRELKLRILNGGHTFSCGLAFLSGLETVKEGMAQPAFGTFMEHLLLAEIASVLSFASKEEDIAVEFAQQVMDRFRNPYLDHQWLSITFQYTSKMQMRNIPVLLKYFALNNEVPQAMALGFAAYLLFMQGVKKEESRIFGQLNGKLYWIQDDQANYFFEIWQQASPEELVFEVLKNTQLWGTDLTLLPGFAATVSQYLIQLQTIGVKASVANFQSTLTKKN